MKNITRYARRTLAMLLMLICVCSTLSTLTGTAAYACNEVPSFADLDLIGDDIEYPQPQSYLSKYEYMVVHAPHAVGLRMYSAPVANKELRRPFIIQEGAAVTVIARENGYSCVITENNKGNVVSGWLNSNHLYDYGDDSYREVQENARYDDALKKAETELFVFDAPEKVFDDNTVFYANVLSCKETGSGWVALVERITWDWLPDSFVENLEAGSKVNIHSCVYTVMSISSDKIVFTDGSYMIPTSVDPEHLDNKDSKGWLLCNKDGNAASYVAYKTKVTIPESAVMVNNTTNKNALVGCFTELSSPYGYIHAVFRVSNGEAYYIESIC